MIECKNIMFITKSNRVITCEDLYNYDIIPHNDIECSECGMYYLGMKNENKKK
jgi:ribosomal protein L33